MSQLLNEEFDSLSLFDPESAPTGIWRPDYGYGDQAEYSYRLNDEVQVFTSPYYRGAPGDFPSNTLSTSNSVLNILASPAPAQNDDLYFHKDYTSGQINTKGMWDGNTATYSGWSFTYGYIEMRADVPVDPGTWPAFWLMRLNPAPGQSFEIDIYEGVGSAPGAVNQTLHHPDGTSNGVVASGVNVSEGFHTFGLESTPTELIFFVDRHETWRTANVPDPQPMFVLADLALGGQWAGAPSLPNNQAIMAIDYIKAWSSFAEAAGSAGPTLNGNDSGPSTLTGGAGDDVFLPAHQADVMTGGAGADTFRFTVTPWNAGHITDFTLGTDRLDFATLFQNSNYTGSNPMADGYVSLSQQNGATLVWYDVDGPSSGSPWPFLMTTLDGVTTQNLTWSQLTNTGAQPLTLTGNDNAPSTLTGGAGNDLFLPAHRPDVMTGGGGGDTFRFTVTPWNAGHITDFTLGADRLDFATLFQNSNYTGSNPVADGYVSLSQQNGATLVWYDVDGPSSGSPWPFLMTTLDGVTGQNITWAQLTNTGAQGLTLTGNDNAPSTLTGGAGNDLFLPAHHADVMTGGGGADTFRFTVTPWNAGHISDFTLGTDRLDFATLFQNSGYSGSDPMADGYVSVTQQDGNTLVWYDVDGPSSGSPWPFLMTTLDGVTAQNLSWPQLSLV